VANVIKGFSRDRDHMWLMNFEFVRGFDAEWKFLRRPSKHCLPNLAPLWANGNFDADGSNVAAAGILKRNVNVSVCFHFCVNDVTSKRVPFCSAGILSSVVPVGPSPSQA
jgi:hypothetical protein